VQSEADILTGFIFMTIIIMGVTGSGKTTVGTLLAKQLGWTFADADDFHTPANKEKMSKGIALTDADRGPWLEAIHDAIARWQASGQNAIVACSALKQAYRDLLSDNVDVKFVYLRGNAELIIKRLGHRKGHYAKENLVASQFEALEEPKDSYVVDISGTPEEIVAEIRRQLKLH
jgi:gluconokinase